MRIYIELSDSEYQALRYYTADTLFDATDAHLRSVIRGLIVARLLETGLVDRKDIIEERLNAHPVLPEVTEQPQETKKEVEAPKTPEAKKKPTKPQKSGLVVPGRMYGNEESSTWKIWAFMIDYCMSGTEPRWYSFPQAQLKNQFGSLSAKQFGNCLGSIRRAGWIYRDKSNYKWTEEGKSWILKNQEFLKKEGVIKDV